MPSVGGAELGTPHSAKGGGEVGMMMLDAYRGQAAVPRQRQAPFGGNVIGMGIHRHDPRLEAVKVPVKLQIAPVIGMRRRFLQVAHVLRDDGLPVLEQAEGRFQLSAHGQHGRRILEARRQRERRWRVAPRAAQHPWLAGHHPRDAIVEAVHNIAVTPSFMTLTRRKLAGLASQNYNRCGNAGEQHPLLLRQAPHTRQSPPSHAPSWGERLAIAGFALAQPGHRARVAGVAGQMEPAQALDGDDLPGCDERRRSLYRIAR